MRRQRRVCWLLLLLLPLLIVFLVWSRSERLLLPSMLPMTLAWAVAVHCEPIQAASDQAASAHRSSIIGRTGADWYCTTLPHGQQGEKEVAAAANCLGHGRSAPLTVHASNSAAHAWAELQQVEWKELPGGWESVQTVGVGPCMLRRVGCSGSVDAAGEKWRRMDLVVVGVLPLPALLAGVCSVPRGPRGWSSRQADGTVRRGNRPLPCRESTLRLCQRREYDLPASLRCRCCGMESKCSVWHGTCAHRQSEGSGVLQVLDDGRQSQRRFDLVFDVHAGDDEAAVVGGDDFRLCTSVSRRKKRVEAEAGCGYGCRWHRKGASAHMNEPATLAR